MAVDVVPTVIYSSMLGITVLSLINTLDKPKLKPNLYLAGLLGLLIIHILGELYIYSGFYRYAPWLAGAQMPIRTLLGPALYLYAHAVMSPERKFPKTPALLALLGPISVIVLMLPFLFQLSPQEKLALADPATRIPEHWQIAVFTCVSTMLVFVIFTGAYLAVTLKLHHKHKAQLMQRFSSIEGRSLDWFKVVLILWGLAWLLYAIEYTLSFMSWKWFGSGIVLPIAEAFILMLFAHLALKQNVLEDSDKGEPQTIATRDASLPAARMQEIANKLQRVMSDGRMYCDEELSLNTLSTAINVSENHISETLSQHLHTNFFHFVNGYRVKAAQDLLRSSDKLVSTIAYEVGFNSKSTFNSAFKKVSGMTPTAYRTSVS